MGLRIKPASRHHDNYEHIKYGIYKWFKERGQTNQEYILEICGAFAIEHGFKLQPKGNKEKAILTYVHNRFNALCEYAIKEFEI